MVTDGDPTSVEERLPPGPSQPAPDFSSLQGFQFMGARDGAAGEGGTDDEQRRAALMLELDARAARFHQAVDSSIVLASDGTIRWLGDSVAKLAPGHDVLAPRTILLVDEAMSAEAQNAGCRAPRPVAQRDDPAAAGAAFLASRAAGGFAATARSRGQDRQRTGRPGPRAGAGPSSGVSTRTREAC